MNAKQAHSEAPPPYAPPMETEVDLENEEGQRETEHKTVDSSGSDAGPSHFANDAHTQAIAHIVQLVSAQAVTEEQAKTLFARYDACGEGSWRPGDLRLFLLDLQEALGAPRVVPEEALHEALKELQLNIDAPPGVSWVEFKSYLLFLQQAPFQTLHETVNKVVQPQSLQCAVLLSALPAQFDHESIFRHFSSCGHVTRVWLFNDVNSPGSTCPQAIVVFADIAGATGALKLSGSSFAGHSITVEPYRGQEFPMCRVTRKPSVVSAAVAKVYVGAKRLDEQARISATIRQGVDTAGTRFTAFVEEHKVKEKLKSASDSTNEQLKKADASLGVSRKLSEMNEKFQLADKAHKAREEAKKIGDKVMGNPHVQAVGTFLGSVASRVRQSFNEFAEDTRIAIVDEERRRGSDSASALPSSAPS